VVGAKQKIKTREVSTPIIIAQRQGVRSGNYFVSAIVRVKNEKVPNFISPLTRLGDQHKEGRGG